MSETLRLKQYAYRTEDTYVNSIKQYILFPSTFKMIMMKVNRFQMTGSFALFAQTVVDLDENLERHIGLALIADQKGICNLK